ALKDAATNAWGAADVTRTLAPFLRAVSDPVERASDVRELSSRLQVPPAAVDESLKQHEQAQPAPRPAPAAAHPVTPAQPRALAPAVRGLSCDLAAHPDLGGCVTDLELDWIAPGPGRDLVAILRGATLELGKNAVASLLSPESERLDPAQKGVLSSLVAS